MTQNKNPRQLLATVRNGDYAHPGEEEAIDLVFNELDTLNISLHNPIKILDAGCGLGGTANYIRLKKHYDISGIDIDHASIEHAKKHYSDISFINDNLLNIKNYYLSEYFNVIYLFNVLYNFSNKTEVLNLLESITQPGGLLIISDYCISNKTDFHMLDLADKPMHPIILSEIKKTLNDASWKLVKIINLNDHYQKWYGEFLVKLRGEKQNILSTFTSDTYEKVEMAFTGILNKLNTGDLGGCIIFAMK